jgi:hypothetical protein
VQHSVTSVERRLQRRAIPARIAVTSSNVPANSAPSAEQRDNGGTSI